MKKPNNWGSIRMPWGNSDGQKEVRQVSCKWTFLAKSNPFIAEQFVARVPVFGIEVFMILTVSRFRILCLPVVVLVASASVAWGQGEQYLELPIAEEYQTVTIPSEVESDEKRAMTSQNSKARAAIRAGQKATQDAIVNGGNLGTDAISKYLDGFVFPTLTQQSQLTEAGTLRDGFNRAYLPSSLPVQARLNFINNVAVPKLRVIVDDQTLSPAARVNACVMLAGLDEKQLDRRNRTAPRPSLEALRVLNGVLQGADYPDFLKASALSGILRHVQIDGAVDTPRIPVATTSSLIDYVTQSWDQIFTDDAELNEIIPTLGMTRSRAIEQAALVIRQRKGD